jgi:hypothetical protein
MAASQVDVSTTSVTIIATGVQSKKLRIGLKIKNTHATDTLYVTDVSPATAANSWPIGAGDVETWDNEGINAKFMFRGPVYGITSSATIDVRVWETLETKQ